MWQHWANKFQMTMSSRAQKQQSPWDLLSSFPLVPILPFWCSRNGGPHYHVHASLCLYMTCSLTYINFLGPFSTLTEISDLH